MTGEAGSSPRPALALATTLLTLAGAGCPAPDVAPAPDPVPLDVLLVTIDTLRADHVGCYGAAFARTPAIDALARSGVRFDPATTSVPITLPAHATLFTGLDPPVHGVRHNGTFRLGPEAPTLAEILRARGYATAAFVGAFVLDARYGLDRGFEHYDDDVDPGGEDVDPVRFNERPANLVADAAIAWLRARLDEQPARPFFVWAHFFDPHAPYEPPERFREAFGERPYDGEIAFADEQLGRLLALLGERGRLERTLVVVTADHGEGLGEHGEMTHSDLIYDSTMRVPLVFSNPRLFPEERVVRDRVAGLVDVVPTLLARLGIPPPGPPLAGIDLLAGSAGAGRAIYVETLSPLLDYGWSALHGLRTRDDKLILAPAPEYYDLVSDPRETRNLYGDGGPAAALESELARRMREWPPAMEVAGYEEPLDEETRRRLASLGYARAAASEIGVKDPKRMMDVWRRIDLAGQLASQGQAERGIDLIRSVLIEDPNNAKAWYAAARIYERARRPAEAEASLARAVELRPRAEGWVHLARFALGRGAFEACERALAEAERLDPRDGGVHIGRGHLHVERGEWEAALREFRAALEVDPVRSGAYARERIRAIEQRRAED